MRILNKVIIFAAAVLLFSAIFQFKDEKDLFESFNYTLNIYVGTENANQIEAGGFYTVTCSKSEAGSVLKTYDNVLGTSYKFAAAEFDLSEFIDKNNLEIQFSQELNGRLIYYLYGYKISKFEIVNGMRVSMQIIKTDDYIMAALPLILGAY